MSNKRYSTRGAAALPHRFRKSATVAAMGILLAGGAHAAANTWLGANADVFDANNWSLAAFPQGTAPGAAFMNGAGTAPEWSNSSGAENSWNASNELLIGSGSGVNGSFKITSVDNANINYLSLNGPDSDLDISPAPLPLLRVGDDGGKGTLTVDLTGRASVNGGWSGVDATRSGGLGVGIGASSNGQLDVLGGGKDPTAQYYFVPYNTIAFGYRGDEDEDFRNVRIGDGGGTGVVNVNGAGLTLASLNQGNASAIASVLSNGKMVVGSGAGSNGLINVLNGGKLAVAGGPYDTSAELVGANLSTIGKDQGVGSLVLQAPGDNGGLPNRMHFGNGLSVGSSGGQGQLDMLASGKGWIHSATSYTVEESACSSASYYATAVAPLQISDGAAGTSGWVWANGVDTQLLVTGKTTSNTTSSSWDAAVNVNSKSIGRIQVNGGGGLVVANAAKVKVGAASSGYRYDEILQISNYDLLNTVTGLGPVDVAGNGGVYYGSEAAAQPVGSIEASQINLQGADAQVVFNHTESNFQFGMPVVGTGKLVQRAGTTKIDPSYIAPAPVPDGTTWEYDPNCATPEILHPLDQQGFTGTVAVEGGTMVLPVDQPLNPAVALAMSGGVLQQQGTKQAFGAVSMAGGTLQLSGDSGAADTTTAASWTGGSGLVSLDTVLDDGASDGTSDKLKISGAVSGTTKLQISNLGGGGAQTSGNGILVVETAGSPAGAFELDGGPITQGGYVYKLVQVGSNWYLQSEPVPPATGTITVTASVTAPADAPFSGSIPYTLSCTTPDYSSSGTITVTNNVGTPVSITVATGSQCTVSEGSLPAVAGYTWGAPVYVQPSEPMLGGATQALSITNALTKDSTGGTTAKAVPVPALGAGGLAALAGLVAGAIAMLRRRKPA